MYMVTVCEVSAVHYADLYEEEGHYAAIWYPRRARGRRVGPRVRRADCLGPNGAAKSSTGTPENRGGTAGLGHEFYLAPEPQRADR